MLSLDKTSAYPPEQAAYAQKVREILAKTIPHTPKACVITFGCQQNVSDSQRIGGMLSAMGYEFTESPENADFVIFNTCAVREHAEDRVYGNVGAIKKFKKQNPHMLLCVCGCMAQQDSVAQKFKTSYPYVDILFGTQVRHRLPEFVYKRLTTERRVFERELSNSDIVEDVPVRRDGDIKGFLPVMRGCDNFCTYCIVPYVRGRERSRKPEDVIKEAGNMINGGFKEIMLLGQNVNSYGKGLNENTDFADLLYRVNELDGDFRIRFMTSHPKDCTEKLLKAMSECKKVEKHIHLPFQSGSNRILKAMNRRYTKESYLELISKAREYMPDADFTSDIIVGFPGETYEDFKETLDLVSRVRFASLFTFIYSPREGTPAAVMPDPVSRAEKGKWFSELLSLQDGISKAYCESKIGSTARVLFDEISQKEGFITGKTEGSLSVLVNADKSLIGHFADVKITGCDNNALSGAIL